jgi:hypothetical protein
MQDRQEMVAELEMLTEHAAALEEAIKDMDYQIERAMHAVAAGTDDIGHAMGVLTERRNAQLGRMFDLGKMTAQIEDLEQRIQERDEQQPERQAVQAWENSVPAAQEDHLDWLRPVLDAPPKPKQDERHPQREGEERELAEMHREGRKPEDYLDWLKR